MHGGGEGGVAGEGGREREGMGGERKREREGRRGEVAEEALETDNYVVGKLRVKCERAEGLPKMGKTTQKSALDG